MTMWTLDFWKDTGERALKTLVQAVIALIGGGVGITGVVDWKEALLGIASMVILSVLTSIASTLKGNERTPSLVDTGAL